jgi:hypothetical protein
MRAQFFINKSEPASASQPASAGDSKSAHKRGNWVGTLLLIILFLALAGGLVYVGKLYLDAQQQLKSVKLNVTSDVAKMTNEEIDKLLSDVGKHLALPNERPQVLTIANVDQLKISQPFFDSAQNGDKLLVYTRRVIIYRPSVDKVIDLATINPTTESASMRTPLTPQASPSSGVKPAVTTAPVIPSKTPLP